MTAKDLFKIAKVSLAGGTTEPGKKKEGGFEPSREKRNFSEKCFLIFTFFCSIILL